MRGSVLPAESLRKDVRVPIYLRQLFGKYVVRICGYKVGQRQNFRHTSTKTSRYMGCPDMLHGFRYVARFFIGNSVIANMCTSWQECVINVTKNHCTQLTTFKDEVHTDHLQRFHHRYSSEYQPTNQNWENHLISSNFLFSKLRKPFSVGACENLVVLLAVIFLPRLRNARYWW